MGESKEQPPDWFWWHTLHFRTEDGQWVASKKSPYKTGFVRQVMLRICGI